MTRRHWRGESIRGLERSACGYTTVDAYDDDAVQAYANDNVVNVNDNTDYDLNGKLNDDMDDPDNDLSDKVNDNGADNTNINTNENMNDNTNDNANHNKFSWIAKLKKKKKSNIVVISEADDEAENKGNGSKLVDI